MGGHAHFRTAAWQSVCCGSIVWLLGLFDADIDMKPVIANLKKAKVLPKPLQYKLDGLEDKDWEREWMDNFHPIQFGETALDLPKLARYS